MVELTGDDKFTLNEFNRVAKELVNGYSHVDSILLLPNGVVSYVYPYNENAKAIGHNVLEDETRKLGSIETILKNEVAIIGPVKLVQNDKQAFIVRRTIRKEAGFWGLTSSIVFLESIVKVVDDLMLQNEVDAYVISGYNPDSKIDYDNIISLNGRLDGIVSKSVVSIFNTKWELSISKIDSCLCVQLFVFTSLLAIFLLIFLLVRYFKKYRGSEKEKFILENEAHTDFLTGLLNRRGLEYQISTLDKTVSWGTVAIFDLDFFKKINDTYGHDVGDSVLLHFANFCQTRISSDFVLSRSGGEEFILLMPSIEIEQAEKICEELRLKISNETFIIGALRLDITMSGGIACFQHVNEIKSAMTLADKALYKAKHSGRNCVYIN
ncbi:sensor domain-containing diguanylate cyclase [Shewanella halifaxensis]|uniref:sensor domain-containing diguanylate cyclase n=1 Tax=Shewanella halifaxensis TaxID=271098 RepID=UPI000D5A1275|nr:sensor domain-containing diguanylate cyclase [Shewanella halifaxensis]